VFVCLFVVIIIVIIIDKIQQETIHFAVQLLPSSLVVGYQLSWECYLCNWIFSYRERESFDDFFWDT
jgi:type III secretory pathway component EscS